MIASLPMYDRPETRVANDRLWALVRDSLDLNQHPMPDALTREGALEDHWLHPNLRLSQTCSLPYRQSLYGRVRIVGTPVHDIACTPGHYFSIAVARRDDRRQVFTDFNGTTLAYNSRRSQSGWAAALGLADDNGITFGAGVKSLAHQASSKLVADGKADIAVLDAVSWTLIQRYDPWAKDLKEITKTPSTPALPYITSKDADSAALFIALRQAIQKLTVDDRATLCLTDLTTIGARTYLDLPDPVDPFPTKQLSMPGVLS